MTNTSHALAFDNACRLVPQADHVAAAASYVSRDGLVQCAIHTPSDEEPAGSGGFWFRIGSLTKLLVAFAALHHARLTGHDPDADIGTDLSRLMGGSFGYPLTLMALLSHTAGLHNCSVLGDAVAAVPSITAVRNDKARGVFSYSNVGYALVGAWLAHRTGLGFAGWLDRHALRPLGQPAIALVPPRGGQRAIGHVMDPRAGKRTPITLLATDPGLVAPAGYLWATAEGLGGLARALLVPPDSVAAKVVGQMLTAISPPFGSHGLSAGAGIFVMRRAGRRIAFNEGEIAGFRSRIELDLAARTGLVEMVAYSGPGSRRSGSLIGTAGAAALPGQPEPPARRILLPGGAPTYLAPALGVFQCEDKETLRGARLNGVAAILKPARPALWHGATEEGRVLTIRASSGAGGDALLINGIFAPASRLRPRGRRFDPRWFGRYHNGYWIEVTESDENHNTVRIASDYSGTSGEAVIIGTNAITTDMGLVVFSGSHGHARLRLLGTAVFHRRPQAH